MNDQIFNLIVFAVAYFLVCWSGYRIGQKFGIGSLIEFFIPVYNVYLLCRCANISVWFVLGMIIPIVSLVCNVYLWGSIARRLGRNFWLYGIGCSFLVIPIFILAFGNFRPVGVKRDNEPGHVSPSSPSASDEKPETGRMPEREHKPETPRPPALSLFCIRGEYAGNRFEITKEGIIIGRDPAQANLVLKSDKVSKVQVKITPGPVSGSFIAEDMNSVNGTYIGMPFSAAGMSWHRLRGRESLYRHYRIRIGEDGDEFDVR